MASEWSHKTIGFLSECNTDTYSPKESWPFVNYLDTGNITKGSIEHIHYIAAGEKLPSRARRKVLPGDIVYSTVRPNQKHFGIISKPVENMLVSTGFAVLRGKEGISDTRFLYYFLTQDRLIEYLQGIGENSTSAYPAIKPSDIQSLSINLPPLPEQRAIASILGALDDKIDLNRRMNETLESMARAIFKSWFVDFDPVRAKMEGKQPYGMDAETAALFPDRLVESELGLIPEGWNVVDVGTLVELDKTSLKPEEFPETTFLHYSIPAYDSEQNPSLDIGSSIKSSKFVVTDDVVLVSKLNPRIPRVWLPNHDTNHQAICSTELLVLRPRNIENQMLIYVLCCQSSFRNRLMEMATGTSNSHQRVRPDDILDSKIAFDAEVAEKISCHLSSIATLVLNNRNESSTLAELRDLLLPKLLSGDIRVKEAEQMVEAAV
jgi:type I restriction enzyme, S subunit